MEHICHHQSNAVLIGWLLSALSLLIERLYRACYLHRGLHPIRTAADLVIILKTELGRGFRDTS